MTQTTSPLPRLGDADLRARNYYLRRTAGNVRVADLLGLPRPTVDMLIDTYGVNPAHYVRIHKGLPWGGDLCGCPDDRCIGHHHAAGDACGCVDVLATEARRTQPEQVIW